MTGERHANRAGWRLAARLARRETRRRPLRSLLVALLVAVPVAAMVVAVVLVRTEHLSPLQRWHNQSGRADVVVSSAGGLPRPDAQLRALEAHSRVVSMRQEPDRVLRSRDGRRSEAGITVLPMTDPLLRGMYVVQHGHPAAAPDDVFLTRDAAHDLDVRAGDRLVLVAPVRITLRVAGVGVRATSSSITEIVLPPTTRFPALRTGDVSVSDFLELHTPLPEAITEPVPAPQASNWSVSVSPAIAPQFDPYTQSDARAKVRWSWVFGAVVLVVTGIVIAAAFASGARRQLVTLGQLSSNGASPRDLRRMLALQGTFTGVLGAALGAALGALALWAVHARVGDIFGHAVGAYDVRVFDLLPVLVLGVAASTIAALVPARTLSRTPVLKALAGRRPLGTVPPWLAVAGAAAVATGCALLAAAISNPHRGNRGNRGNAWLAVAIAGATIVLIGGCAIAPALVALLERLGHHTFGGLRLASRGLARQRTRSAAVVAAVAATGALAICASSLVLGLRAERLRQAHAVPPDVALVTGLVGNGPPPAATVDAVARVLHDPTRRSLLLVDTRHLTWEVESVEVRGGPSNYAGYRNLAPGPIPALVVVGDRAAVVRYQLTATQQRALHHSGWLVFDDFPGRIEFALGHTAAGGGPESLGTVRAPVVTGATNATDALVLVDPARVHGLALPTRVYQIVLQARRPLTRQQRAAITEVALDANATALARGRADDVAIDVFHPPTGADPVALDWALVGIALALVLFVVAANLALSAAETREERDTMTVVGARRRCSLAPVATGRCC